MVLTSFSSVFGKRGQNHKRRSRKCYRVHKYTSLGQSGTNNQGPHDYKKSPFVRRVLPICLLLSQVLVLRLLWTRDTHPQGSVRDFVGTPSAKRQRLVQPVATPPQLRFPLRGLVGGIIAGPKIGWDQNVEERQRARLYVACIRVAAVVVRDTTRIQPYARPVAVNDTQCARPAGW